MFSRMDKLPFLIIIVIVLVINDMSIAEMSVKAPRNRYFAEEALAFPCSYFDTINITDGIKNDEDDSINHNGIVYKHQQYKEYDYIILASFKKVTVARHIRGCVCHYRKCVRVCCDPGTFFVNKTCAPTDEFPEFNVNIMQDNGDNVTVNLYNDRKYSYTVGKPCESFFTEPPHEIYTLHDNGSLTLENEAYDQYSYCLAYRFQESENDTNGTYTIEANFCLHEKKNIAGVITQYAMLVSVPFLLLTFFVYVWLRELRDTLPGKSLMCYVFVLAIGYGTLGVIQMNGGKQINQTLCMTFGYIIQGSFTASFLWLNVISFDIWWTFGKGKDHSGRRFLKYSLYAWSVTCILLLLCFMMDSLDSIPVSIRPKIGLNQCWLHRDQLVEFLYLYLPILIIVTVNSIFFGMTAHKIRYAQKASAAALTKGDSRKHTKVQSEKEKFSLFFRLFIIMGVTWSMEFIAWALDRTQDTYFFIVTDLCNAIQGILIFILFVCKPRVKKLIVKRYRQMRGLPEPTTVTRTSTTQMSMHHMEKLSLKRNGNVIE